MDDDSEFLRLRKESKTYLSKVFKFDAQHEEHLRYVHMVFEGNDSALLGEVDGAMCLRISGAKRKTQVTALVSQDNKQIKRLSLLTYQTRAGDWIQGYDKNEFTFRDDEFQRLLAFLEKIKFVDMSNQSRFQIEDISTQDGPKAIIDASDRGLVERVKGMDAEQRESLISALSGSLSVEEVNVLLGRKQGLQEFEAHMQAGDWAEPAWQDFFDRHQWVFGYGLDYRVMRQFDREMTVGGFGTDNQNKPTVDFLMQFTDYTVLVEIKRPDTRIFKAGKGGRAGTWEFSQEFTSAVSQIMEQKAEWLAAAGTGEHYNRAGTERLEARTRNAKTILVIGSSTEFKAASDLRARQIMRDTFELFRRETRNIDIVTFDELLERARFITRKE